MTDRYDVEVKEFLLCLPGVTTGNVYSLLAHFSSLRQLIGASEAELTQVLDNSRCASQLYRCFHENCSDETKDDGDQENGSSAEGKNKKSKFTYIRKKPKTKV